MKQLQAILLVIFVSLIMFGIAYSVDGQSIRFANVPLVIASAGLCLEINLFVFIPATIAKTEKYFDLTGSITYLLVMGMAFYAIGDAISLRVVFLAVMVCIWALRLGSYLMRRIRADGKDGRFDELKSNPAPSLSHGFYRRCGFSSPAWRCSLSWPHTQPTPPLCGPTLWGVLAGVSALLLRSSLTHKSLLFEKTLKTKGASLTKDCGVSANIQTTLEKILLWTGMFVIGAGLYEGTQWLAVISPLFIYLLLTKISGINMLDERAEARWGNDSDYQHYRQTTGILIPRPPKNKKR